MSFSKCIDIVNRMDQEDQDTILAKLDSYLAMGIPADKAQKMAATDTLEELKAEEAEFMRLVQEQHPEPVEEPVAEAKEPEVTPVVQSSAKDVTDTDAFKAWSGGAVVVPLGTKHQFSSGNPVVVEVQ